MTTSFSTVTAQGHAVPLYLIQGDKSGTLKTPEAYRELVDKVTDGTFHDVYVFAHGWNNDFDESVDLFKRFFTGFLERRVPSADWKPVFVGVQWPSVVLVFPWEKGPAIAGGNNAEADRDFQHHALGVIGDELDDAEAARLRELAGRGSLEAVEQVEAVGLARAAMRGSLPEIARDTLPTEAELLESWRALDQASRPSVPVNPDFGFADEPDAAAAAGTAQAAGLLSALDPRNLIRGATVYMMKDRAGTIGANLVGPLLQSLTGAGASVRLVGHSYGCRVMLAALSTATLPYKARSALLLQPAVNQYCFAEAGSIPHTQGSGGFARAIDQVELPIYSTFSPHDFPLHDTFHLALRRAKDLGEAELAAEAPPSIYCALGGYGPQGMANGSASTIPIVEQATFEYPATARVVALDGAGERITSHGDVTNAFTCWALAEQDARPV
ncbi:hypothetical protein [Variovorax arabinosiphilus]|uniref:hypothetical protein n=1 Tax=Variovorax arabinosiphilus TaxID=3053498 RepID=UPI002575440B|nr:MULTISPECIES: hypothetical protein [unclassified Variovorax]MDM0122587.1 hypothetical protein [Variovorax sp. J2L1-78]MDM0130884.1 hypothetical protein [Variovorax sp. J2L1-63]MDM0235350.1 hypothetical protein [Variovorax sp. J2R1-6]